MKRVKRLFANYRPISFETEPEWLPNEINQEVKMASNYLLICNSKKMSIGSHGGTSQSTHG